MINTVPFFLYLHIKLPVHTKMRWLRSEATGLLCDKLNSGAAAISGLLKSCIKNGSQNQGL